jgi:peptidoglycan/xylan/chitin deacetylase (PgdA/CDA1 family)
LINRLKLSIKLFRENRSLFIFLILSTVVLLGAQNYVWQQSLLQTSDAGYARDNMASLLINHELHTELASIRVKIARLEDEQTQLGIKVVDDIVIQDRLSGIRRNIHDNIDVARARLKKLSDDTDGWQAQLDSQMHATKLTLRQPLSTGKTPSTVTIKAGYLKIPILIYHKTPPDFDAQMKQLVAKGYTAVDLDQVSTALRSDAPLPKKPVVITFDDGFGDQMHAFTILSHYHLKATYYIISGGEASKYCIGANRHDGLRCGDAYLSWDEIRSLDRSGLITIGGHTVDHFNLDSLSAAQQQFEITTNKAEIERQLGHTIHHFAYPYGSYNAMTVNLVRQAGYLSSVTTLPGMLQSSSNLYTLHRSRSVAELP